jgi:hypothetical protein
VHNSQSCCHTQDKYLIPLVYCWRSCVVSRSKLHILSLVYCWRSCVISGSKLHILSLMYYWRSCIVSRSTTYIYPDVRPSFQHISSVMSSPINQTIVRNILVFDLPLLTINNAQLYSKFSLMRHTKAVNALSISPDGLLLLSRGN